MMRQRQQHLCLWSLVTEQRTQGESSISCAGLLSWPRLGSVGCSFLCCWTEAVDSLHLTMLFQHKRRCWFPQPGWDVVKNTSNSPQLCPRPWNEGHKLIGRGADWSGLWLCWFQRSLEALPGLDLALNLPILWIKVDIKFRITKVGKQLKLENTESLQPHLEILTAGSYFPISAADQSRTFGFCGQLKSEF